MHARSHRSLLARLSIFIRTRFPFLVDLLLLLPGRLLFFRRNRRFRGMSMGQVFRDIYDNNLWSHPESRVAAAMRLDTARGGGLTPRTENAR